MFCQAPFALYLIKVPFGAASRCSKPFLMCYYSFGVHRGPVFFLPTRQIMTVCEACVCVSLSDGTGTPEELILSWDSDQFLICFREITPAFNIISLWIVCVMFDGVFYNFESEKFCIFNYVDEYDISYYNFISIGQTFNCGWNYSSCFCNRGAFAIIRTGRVILCGDSMLWNCNVWKQNVKDSCIDAILLFRTENRL